MKYEERLMLLDFLGLSGKELPYISSGNLKVKCPIFNLPSGTTCRPGVECCGYCYAKKAEVFRPRCLPCRKKNYALSQESYFVKAMYYQLSVIFSKNTKKHNKNYFRFQEAGDIYSVEYLYKLYEIAKSFPNVSFYAYTKRSDILKEKDLKKRPKNFNINYSIDGIKTTIPKEIPKGYDNVVCTHPTDSNCPVQLDKNKKCMVDCFKCASPGHVVIFKKH